MDNYRNQEPFAKNGLYDPRFEHENCGIGAVVNMDGTSDRKVVDSALRIVETLEHRAGKDAEGKTGDGVGILLQISHTYFSKVAKEAGIHGSHVKRTETRTPIHPGIQQPISGIAQRLAPILLHLPDSHGFQGRKAVHADHAADAGIFRRGFQQHGRTKSLTQIGRAHV